MRKFAILSVAAVSMAALTATAADARPRGYYGGHGYAPHAGYGYGGGYRGGRRGIGTGAAVGLGIAGLAAGAIAAGAARDAYYNNGYGYGRPSYGYYGYPY